MKLEALLEARKKANATSHERNSARYEQALQEGMQALANYQSSNFRLRAELKKACELLTEAMGADRSKPEPYVALGYVFILVDDAQTATRLLTDALRKDPQNGDAKMFLEYLQVKHQIKAKKAAAAAPLQPKPSGIKPLPEEEVDLDLLYDRTEALLVTQLQLISQSPQPQVSVDKETGLAFKKRLREFQSFILDIRADIDLIDTEIQTDELQQQLKPLEKLLVRYQQIDEFSQLLRDLRQRIRSEAAEVADLIKQVSKHSPAELDRLTEKYLDSCDAVADQMDDLETRGCPIDLLNSDYQNWVSLLENLQDTVDEVNR
ncbi:MAG: hypothetical protein AB7I41_12885 [Candidatus Sericytochromatia bacterium]